MSSSNLLLATRTGCCTCFTWTWFVVAVARQPQLIEHCEESSIKHVFNIAGVDDHEKFSVADALNSFFTSQSCGVCNRNPEQRQRVLVTSFEHAFSNIST